MTKYDFEISTANITVDINRLTNQLWKLIPMRENDESWESQLETVIIELVGLNKLLNIDEQYLILLSKLEGLRIIHVDFTIYRKTVFECISLLRNIKYE
jgi:hypothetical protein